MSVFQEYWEGRRYSERGCLQSSPSDDLEGGGAEVGKGAGGAGWFAGGADGATVVDQHVGEVEPVLLGDDAHEVLFDFYGVFAGGPAETAGEATDMGVYYEAYHDAVGVAQYDVGGFARNAGQCEQLFHRARHLAAVAGEQTLGRAAQVSGFVAVKSG